MMMIMDDEYGGFLICNFVSYYKFMLKNFPLHFSLLWIVWGPDSAYILYLISTSCTTRSVAFFPIFLLTITDGPTDLRTYGRTDPLLEMRGCIKKKENERGKERKIVRNKEMESNWVKRKPREKLIYCNHLATMASMLPANNSLE